MTSRWYYTQHRAITNYTQIISKILNEVHDIIYYKKLACPLGPEDSTIRNIEQYISKRTQCLTF